MVEGINLHNKQLYMKKYNLSKHARNIMIEREIQLSWINSAIQDPDQKILIEKKEIHYIKKISEFGNRYLRVVVNPTVNPMNIVTVFFDRRLIKGEK